MKNKGIRRFWLLIPGLLLVALGGFFLVKNVADDKNAAKNSAAILETLQLRTETDQNPQGITLLPESPPQGQEVTKGLEEAVGVLELPTLSLTLPILKECSYPLLELAPCQYQDSQWQEEGDQRIAIAGHSWASQFGKLSTLSPGDQIRYTPLQQETATYTATQCLTLAGNDQEAFWSGDWDLTLFTCTFDGSQRILVRFEKTE